MDENFCFKANTDAIDREFPIEPGRFIGRTRWQAAGVDPDKNEKWRLHREDLLAHRPFRDFEYALPGEDGATRHLNISGSPIFDDTGAFKGYRGSATDITERKQAEEAARESDERLRGAVESMQEGFALYDADDRLVAFNKEYQRIQPLAQEIMDAGGTFEDVIRTQVKKGYIPEAKGQEEAFIKERLERHHYPQGPIYRQYEDGKRHMINETRTPEGGTALSFTDITELKKAEEAAEKSEMRLIDAIESLSDGFVYYNSNRRLVYCNDRYREFYPWIADLLVPGAGLDDIVRAAAEGGQDAEPIEDPEAWTKARLADFEGARKGYEQILQSGRSLLCSDSRSRDGGFVGIRTDITGQKKIEEARRESEERFRSFIDNSPMFITIKDRDGRFNLVNKGHAAHIDLEPQEILGKPISEFFPKKVADDSAAQDRRVFETKSVIVEERPIITKKGTFDYLVTKFPIFDGSGAVKEVGTLGIDITERKQAENALRLSENRFWAFTENSLSSILVKDTEGHFLTANKRWHEWFNPKGLDIQGKTSFDFHPEDHAEKITFQDREVVKTGKGIEWEYETPLADGRVLSTLIQKFPIFNDDGKVIAIGSMSTDMTERKQAEEAILETQARLSGIIRIAPEAIITVDEDMTIRLFNEGAQRIFGYSVKEVLYQPLEILMPEDFRNGHRKHVEGFEFSKDTYRLMDQRQEIFGLRKDGTEFPAAASVSKFEIGGEKMFTVMLQDITERKQNQDALLAAKGEAETANCAKSEFLAAMSHELRTPLNAILGFADILSHQYFGPIGDKYKEYAGDIETSGQHLLTLVNEILDLSAIEAGKQSLIKESLSTKEIVDECEKIIVGKAQSNGIGLVTKIPKDLPPIYADRRAAMQILLNLLSNAVKFTPKRGGGITVSVKASKQGTTLMVTDTGKGIHSDELPKLTDPFTRADTDPYLAEQGWGLGLSITKSLVDLHDGTLDIESILGKGTTVTVTLPNEAA